MHHYADLLLCRSVCCALYRIVLLNSWKRLRPFPLENPSVVAFSFQCLQLHTMSKQVMYLAYPMFSEIEITEVNKV